MKTVIQTPIDDPDGEMPLTIDSRDYERVLAERDELAEALAKAVPWLGKMIADKAHLHCVAPNVCVKVLEHCEKLLAKIGAGK